MTTTTDTATVTRRDRVGWADLAWLTWRQHRWAIVGLVAVVAALIALALVVAWRIDATDGAGELFGRWRYLSVAQVLMLGPMAIGLAVALFWAAPLLSREYEQRTHVVAWSQDITPTRWLTGKVVLLGVPAVVLSACLGLATIGLTDSVNAAVNEFRSFGRFESPVFEAMPLVQAGYTAFGFALGLAFSAVTRRTVLSMALTLGSFIAVGVAVISLWRPYYQEPLREVQPYDPHERSWAGPGDGAWTVDNGFTDAAGNEILFNAVCSGVRDGDDFVKCMVDANVRFFTDYHPAERFATFQLVEFAIFTVLAAGLFALAFARVRRASRV